MVFDCEQIAFVCKCEYKIGRMKKTIVVAEDNDMVSRALVSRLECEGYEVRAFMNGEAAIVWMESNPFDLLITDLYPVLNGIKLIHEIQEKTSVTIPIMLISVTHDKDLVDGLLKMGVSDFVPKPFHLEQLSLRVKRLLKLNSSQINNSIPLSR